MVQPHKERKRKELPNTIQKFCFLVVSNDSVVAEADSAPVLVDIKECLAATYDRDSEAVAGELGNLHLALDPMDGGTGKGGHGRSRGK